MEENSKNHFFSPQFAGLTGLALISIGSLSLHCSETFSPCGTFSLWLVKEGEIFVLHLAVVNSVGLVKEDQVLRSPPTLAGAEEDAM